MIESLLMSISNLCSLKYPKNIWMQKKIFSLELFIEFQIQIWWTLMQRWQVHYNIELLNFEKHDLTNEFVDVLYCNEFLPLISRPTRITSTCTTLIDNIFINNHDDLNCSLNGIFVADISDHFPVFHISRSFSMEETLLCLVTRVYNERIKQKFLEASSAVDWSETCNIPYTQNFFNHFHSMLISLHDECFPKIRIKKEILW